MGRYYKILLILGALLFNSLLSAKDDGVSTYRIEPHDYDFGNVLKDQGPLNCSFKIENISKKPFLILNVSTSCGCTKAMWSKKPIRPGQYGIIDIVYSNNEGAYPFDKRVLVKISSEDVPFVLHVKGNVISEVDNDKERYTSRIGLIGLMQREYELGDVHPNQTYKGIIPLYNYGKDAINYDVYSLCESLRVRCDKKVLPQSFAAIEYSLKLSDNFYGNHMDTIVISYNKKRFSVRKGMILLGYRVCSKRTSIVGDGPIATLSDEHISLGKVCGEKKANISLSISNSGTGPLNIYQIEIPENMKMSFSPKVLLSGEMLNINAELDLESVKKRNVAEMTIYTDSIKGAVQHAYITYEVSRSWRMIVLRVYSKIKDIIRLER